MLQCGATGDKYNEPASHAHMLQADAIYGPGGIRHTQLLFIKMRQGKEHRQRVERVT